MNVQHPQLLDPVRITRTRRSAELHRICLSGRGMLIRLKCPSCGPDNREIEVIFSARKMAFTPGSETPSAFSHRVHGALSWKENPMRR